jgi:hypothetical protein
MCMFGCVIVLYECLFFSHTPSPTLSVCAFMLYSFAYNGMSLYIRPRSFLRCRVKNGKKGARTRANIYKSESLSLSLSIYIYIYI